MFALHTLTFVSSCANWQAMFLDSSQEGTENGRSLVVCARFEKHNFSRKSINSTMNYNTPPTGQTSLSLKINNNKAPNELSTELYHKGEGWGA